MFDFSELSPSKLLSPHARCCDLNLGGGFPSVLPLHFGSHLCVNVRFLAHPYGTIVHGTNLDLSGQLHLVQLYGAITPPLGSSA